MKPTTITFADIQTSDLLYYDPEFAEESLAFCKERDIDCLPSLDHPQRFYHRKDNRFVHEDVPASRMVIAEEYIFNDTLLKKFQEFGLLFVYSHGELTGVVHYSDYNREEVKLYLFELLSSYERSLRELLKLSGLNDQDMLEYFRYEAKFAKKQSSRDHYQALAKDFEEDLSKGKKIPAFELCCLKDLMELANYRKVIKVNQDVNNLRNDIMHVHDLVKMQDPYSDDYIYNFETFTSFFTRVISLMKDCKKVNTRIAFLRYVME